MKNDYIHAILVVEDKKKGFSAFLLEMLSYYYAPLDVVFVADHVEDIYTDDEKYRYDKDVFDALVDQINNMYPSSDDEAMEVIFAFDLTDQQRVSFAKALYYPFSEYSDLLCNYFYAINKSTLNRFLCEKMYNQVRRNNLALARMNAKELASERKSIEQEDKVLDKQIAPLLKKRSDKMEKIYNSATPLVAIFGYPDSGKSTLYAELLERLKGEEVRRESFTTDNKVKLIKNYRYPDFYLMNGIGYLETKPNLVDTYYDVFYQEFALADLIIDVVDVTNPNYLEHIETCEEFIKSISRHPDVKIIHLLNKADDEMKVQRLPRSNEMLVSLINDDDFDETLSFILSSLFEGWEKKTFLLPFEIPIETCYKQNYVTSVEIKETGHLVTCYLNPKYLSLYLPYIS